MIGDGQFPIYGKLCGLGRSGKLFVRDLIARETGKAPQQRAMNKWADYGRIPSKYIIIISRECQKMRIKFTDDDFNSRTKERDNG